MKVGIADYGMNVWYGNNWDWEERQKDIKSIGYDGLERLQLTSAEDALHKAATLKKLGMDFATCRGISDEIAMQWTAALGKTYVWAAVDNGKNEDWDYYCRQVNYQIEACERYGVHVVIHNHLGKIVESQESIERILKDCPKVKLLLDTGHLHAAGGDPVAIAEKYYDRIEAIHLKDYVYKDKSISIEQNWQARLRFCGLGGGEMQDVNDKVVKIMLAHGFDGWMMIEHDTHLQDPLKDLKASREYLRKLGV